MRRQSTGKIKYRADEDCNLSVHSHIHQDSAYSAVIKIYGLHTHGRIACPFTLQRGTGGVLEDDA